MSKMTRSQRRVAWVLAAFVSPILIFTGCGRSDLGQVSGQITLDGDPLPHAFVEFTPTGPGGGVSYGVTDENGTYKMAFSRNVNGASLGDNRVAITTADVRDDDGREVRVPELVPSRYNKRSDLTRSVERGSNVYNFDLSSEK